MNLNPAPVSAAKPLMQQDTPGPCLSVVIPALNEEDGIADIVQRVDSVRSRLRDVGVVDLEIIVVDDGSDDATARIVEEMPEASLIRHDGNRGYGAAIKTGFAHSRGELVAFLDADSTYPPEHFSELCAAILDDGADVAVGSRRSGAKSEMPAVRRFGNLIWSTLLTVLGNTRVQDPASGMRVVRKEALTRLYPLPDGLNFTPVMSTRSVHEGLKVAEIPIPYHERSGRSKLSVVRDGTRFLKTIIWTALEYNPARVLELAGLGSLVAAVLFGGLIVAMRLQGITRLDSWGVFAVYASLVLGITGVSVLSLGYSFNYLVALFHHRPISQVSIGSRLFGPALERHFGWIGLLVALVGGALGIVGLALGLNGWEIPRLWLWLVGSALFVLVGVQLVLSWLLMRILEALHEREGRIEADFKCSGGMV
jgi:glycosyltransferase involved in cell wall biosynthesis